MQLWIGDVFFFFGISSCRLPHWHWMHSFNGFRWFNVNLRNGMEWFLPTVFLFRAINCVKFIKWILEFNLFRFLDDITKIAHMICAHGIQNIDLCWCWPYHATSRDFKSANVNVYVILYTYSHTICNIVRNHISKRMYMWMIETTCQTSQGISEK